MKNITTIIAALFLMTFAINVNAQNSATDDATATARIITKITLEKDIDINFGTIAQTTTGGTVTLTAASDEASYSNTASVIASSTESRAHFNVAGEANATYGITLPSNATLTRTDGSETMIVSNFVTGTLTGNTLTDGEDDFYVGAKLTVEGNQVPGQYTGSFDVTVTYE